MTSFPALALPAVDHRHHGDRGTCEPWHAARSTMTSFPPSASRLSIDRHGGTCEPWGPWHDDQLAGAGLAGVSFLVVDRRARRHVRAVGTVA